MKKIATFALLALGVALVGSVAAQDPIKDPNTVGRQPSESTHPFVPTGTSPFCSTPGGSIPDNCDAGVCLEDTIVMAEGFAITDLNISVDITHTFLGDLEIFLTSPTTAQTIIWNDPCAGENDMSVTIDDEGAPIACAEPLIGTFVDQAGALAAFDGETATGNWTIRVSDTFGGDTGTLNEWCLITTPVPVELKGFEVE